MSALAAGLADAVRRHLAGDERAMTEVVRWVTPWLFHLCQGYRLSAHTAEDVVQNTLLALTQHAQSLRDPQCALSWISVVARREAIRAANLERRTQPLGDMASLESAIDHRDPARIMEAKVLRTVIARCLSQLTTRKREVLRLAFLAEPHDYVSIARILDMPIGSIGPTRLRALEKMRELLCSDEEWCLNQAV